MSETTHSAPAPTFLATLAAELKGELKEHYGDQYVSVSVGFRAALEIQEDTDAASVVDGPGPQYRIALCTWDETGAGDDGTVHAVANQTMVRAAAQGILNHIEAEGAKAEHDMGVCGGPPCPWCTGPIDGVPSRGEAERTVFSELVALRGKSRKSDEDRARFDGMFAAYAALTGADGEQLYEALEDAAQAAHDEMIASMEMRDF